jgi:hypothetical protein
VLQVSQSPVAVLRGGALGAAGVPSGAAKVEETEVCFLLSECVSVDAARGRERRGSLRNPLNLSAILADGFPAGRFRFEVGPCVLDLMSEMMLADCGLGSWPGCNAQPEGLTAPTSGSGR